MKANPTDEPHIPEQDPLEAKRRELANWYFDEACKIVRAQFSVVQRKKKDFDRLQYCREMYLYLTGEQMPRVPFEQIPFDGFDVI